MKKLFIIVLIFSLCASTVFTGGAVNKNNFSAGYLRTLSKNTETEKPDATFYNPAGTTFMLDGLHIALDNQFVFKKYTADNYRRMDVEDTTPVFLYPSISLVWKMTDFAVFANFGVVAGGGTLEYDVSSSNATIKASSMIFGETIGVSYKFFDKISVATAIRFTHGSKTTETTNVPSPFGTSEVEEKQEFGLGWLASVHIKPIETLDITIQYQSRITTRMEVTSSNNPVLGVLDKKTRAYLPAMLGAGIGVRIFEPLYASLSFNYYFNEDASYAYDNGCEIGLSSEYDIAEMVSASLGFLYTYAGQNDKDPGGNNPLSSVLDSISIGGGVELRFLKDLKIDIGIFNAFYFDDKYGTAELTKNVFTVGIGVSYRFF